MSRAGPKLDKKKKLRIIANVEIESVTPLRQELWPASLHEQVEIRQAQKVAYNSRR